MSIKVKVLASELNLLFAIKALPIMPIKGNFTTFDLERAHKAIAYIEKHYDKKIPPENLAAEDDINMNVKLLQKIMQHLTGLSIHRYQSKIRVQHALEDLP